MRTLVTGGSGFVGRHLVDALYDRGADVLAPTSKECDLRSYTTVAEYLNQESFDHIYHLAVDTKAGKYSETHQVEDLERNTLINTNIVRYWREHSKTALFLGLGTCCSYREGLEDFGIEENYLQGHPSEGLRTYALSKRMLLENLRAHSNQYCMRYSYLIPATLYGPGFSTNDNHFIFDFIRKISTAKANDEEVELWGNGTQRRELLHIDTAVQLMIKLSKEPIDIMNIGTGKSQYLRTYANLLAELMDFDHKRIVWNRDEYSGCLARGLETAQLREHLGIPLEETEFYVPLVKGLKECVDYYEENFGNG